MQRSTILPLKVQKLSDLQEFPPLKSIVEVVETKKKVVTSSVMDNAQQMWNHPDTAVVVNSFLMAECEEKKIVDDVVATNPPRPLGLVVRYVGAKIPSDKKVKELKYKYPIFFERITNPLHNLKPKATPPSNDSHFSNRNDSPPLDTKESVAVLTSQVNNTELIMNVTSKEDSSQEAKHEKEKEISLEDALEKVPEIGSVKEECKDEAEESEEREPPPPPMDEIWNPFYFFPMLRLTMSMSPYVFPSLNQSPSWFM